MDKVILHVDVLGIEASGKSVSLRQRGGVVRDGRMALVGKVLHAEFVGRGGTAVRATVEIDKAKLREVLDA